MCGACGECACDGRPSFSNPILLDSDTLLESCFFVVVVFFVNDLALVIRWLTMLYYVRACRLRSCLAPPPRMDVFRGTVVYMFEKRYMSEETHTEKLISTV